MPQQKRFDFHDILTGKPEGLPEAKPAEKKPEANEAAKTDSKPEPKAPEAKHPVYFQAGSFTLAGDADNQKAKLALLGVEASHSASDGAGEDLYRVRIGPYANGQEASQARSNWPKMELMSH